MPLRFQFALFYKSMYPVGCKGQGRGPKSYMFAEVIKPRSETSSDIMTELIYYLISVKGSSGIFLLRLPWCSWDPSLSLFSSLIQQETSLTFPLRGLSVAEQEPVGSPGGTEWRQRELQNCPFQQWWALRSLWQPNSAKFQLQSAPGN